MQKSCHHFHQLLSPLTLPPIPTCMQLLLQRGCCHTGRLLCCLLLGGAAVYGVTHQKHQQPCCCQLCCCNRAMVLIRLPNQP